MHRDLAHSQAKGYVCLAFGLNRVCITNVGRTDRLCASVFAPKSNALQFDCRHDPLDRLLILTVQKSRVHPVTRGI